MLQEVRYFPYYFSFALQLNVFLFYKTDASPSQKANNSKCCTLAWKLYNFMSKQVYILSGVRPLFRKLFLHAITFWIRKRKSWWLDAMTNFKAASWIFLGDRRMKKEYGILFAWYRQRHTTVIGTIHETHHNNCPIVNLSALQVWRDGINGNNLRTTIL